MGITQAMTAEALMGQVISVRRDHGSAPSREPGASFADEPTTPEALDRTMFFKRLLRELTGTLEEVVGIDRASSYVATVGAAMGEWLNAAYHAQLSADDFDIKTVAQVFVDLKARIDGGFTIETITADEIVLRNTRCPFGQFAVGRPSLCMMTSNVFGRIAAENQDYASVTLNKTIAAGDGECHVVVSFRRDGERNALTRDYYRASQFDFD